MPNNCRLYAKIVLFFKLGVILMLSLPILALTSLGIVIFGGAINAIFFYS